MIRLCEKFNDILLRLLHNKNQTVTQISYSLMYCKHIHDMKSFQ